MKKLYRSNKDQVLGGVLGGFAEYVEKDPTIVRLGYVFITLIANVAGIIFYIICWIIIPNKETKVSREPIIDHKNSDVIHETTESKAQNEQKNIQK
jgi:phage shock protein C